MSETDPSKAENRPLTLAQNVDSGNVSPKTPNPPNGETEAGYFSAPTFQSKQQTDKTSDGSANDEGAQSPGSSNVSPGQEASNPASPVLDGALIGAYPGIRTGSLDQRKASISILPPRNRSLPQGGQKKTDATRIRASSPPPKRFQSHVAFDNLPLGEATKSNTISLTLNVRHKGYQALRRSRTFMVGVDENAYSDYALQWLLDELVDDGDEMICVRVIEKEIRAHDKSYQEDAQNLMQSIVKKNGANRAISIVLEYACGKLHSTFQRLIQMYQPAMLIVGTRGRSLGGLQGLMNTRNSFSKYCLQYSPVPVVVVRPTEKRERKKSKRMNDAERQTYVRMLSATGGKHEADSERSSMYEAEVRMTADEEAHQVAKELGLPASFDPTIKPINPDALLHNKYGTASTTSLAPQPGPASGKVPAAPSTIGDSEDESEDEFEVVTGQQALNSNQLEKLHSMEVGEAAALLGAQRKSSVDSASPDDEDENHSGKHSRTSSTS